MIEARTDKTENTTGEGTSLPLILITRPEPRAGELAALLESTLEENCALRVAPAQDTAPVEDPEPARAQINSRPASARWVFVSTAAVEHGLALMDSDTRAELNGRCIAVGPATGEALRSAGITDVRIPDDHRSEGLLRLDDLQSPTTASDREGSEVVIVNAAGGRQLLIQKLGQRGFEVTEIHVYQRSNCEWPDALWDALESADDLRVVATSAGAIRALFDGRSRSRRAALREAHWILPSERIQVICTGFGVTRFTVAADAGNEALADAVRESLTA